MYYQKLVKKEEIFKERRSYCNVNEILQEEIDIRKDIQEAIDD